MSTSSKKELKVITNLESANVIEKKRIYEILGIQLWLITRKNPTTSDSFVANLLFGRNGSNSRELIGGDNA